MSRERGNSTSRSLIARARDGDTEAWERLLALYEPLVGFWCRQSGLPADDVADLAQETFQAAASNLAKFRIDRPGDTFRGWLRTIATNKIRDRFRQKQREPSASGGSEMAQWLQQQPEPAAGEPPGESTAFAQVLTAALARIRHAFRDNTWQAFWRTTVDGRPPADVGQELAMSVGAVRVAKSRVLQRLRVELGDQPPSPT